jgi:hypothetical protein
LADAIGARHRALSTAVTGRPGSGRSTLASALRQVLSIEVGVSPGPADALPDLWCHTLSGPPRAGDTRIIDDLPAERTVVVLTKADVYRSGPATHKAGADDAAWPFGAGAASTAARCARALGRPVLAVSGLWAVAAPTSAQTGLLAALAAAGEAVPDLDARFAAPTGVGGDDEGRLRAELLRVMGGGGVELVLGELRAGAIGPDAAQVARLLRGASGIGALRAHIAACAGAVADARTAELGMAADRIAAAGAERAAAEQLLADLGRGR